MLKKLQDRWKVNGWSLLLILLTFAIGGSLCGYLGRQILGFLQMPKGAGWIILYILLITLLWPLCVIIISVPFGQFAFFKKYISKIFSRFGATEKKNTVKRLAIFASGAGSNAQKIIEYFRGNKNIIISLIVSSKVDAGVVQVAANNHIQCIILNRELPLSSQALIDVLQEKEIDMIVLAGFLKKIPAGLIHAYPHKIINIHPALLPLYGGKGMYGAHVHEAVIANREKQSGITIHYVDEVYDHGAIIFQASCKVVQDDTPASLAQKIHTLEHEHYPAIIETLLKSKIEVK